MVAVDENNKESFLLFLRLSFHSQQLLSLSHFFIQCSFLLQFYFYDSPFSLSAKELTASRLSRAGTFLVQCSLPPNDMLDALNAKHCCRRIGKTDENIKFRRSSMKTSGNIKAKTWKGAEMSVLVFELHICEDGWDGG